MIKLRILRPENYSELSSVPNVITEERETGELERFEDAMLLSDGEGARAKTHRCPLEAGKENGVFLRATRRNTALLTTGV